MFDLIIIGAGPAGISMAVEAIHAGISSKKILILEKSIIHSWSIRKFYPEEKLVTANFKGQTAVCNGVMCLDNSSKNETLSYLDQAIVDNSINVHYEETVDKIQKNKEDIFTIRTNKNEYQTKTCVIAIGMMGKPNRPSFKIESSIKKFVHYDITSVPIENKKVLVVGGGDSASEYAQYLIQKNNQVTLSYRKKSFIRLNQLNLNSIKALLNRGQIKLNMGSNVQSITSSEGLNTKVSYNEEEFVDEEYDHIILALGGTSPKNFLKLLNIDFDGESPIIHDGYETSIPGLFLIGDLSAGRKGGSIISAFNSSNMAMKNICTHYLECSL